MNESDCRISLPESAMRLKSTVPTRGKAFWQCKRGKANFCTDIRGFQGCCFFFLVSAFLPLRLCSNYKVQSNAYAIAFFFFSLKQNVFFFFPHFPPLSSSWAARSPQQVTAAAQRPLAGETASVLFCALFLKGTWWKCSGVWDLGFCEWEKAVVGTMSCFEKVCLRSSLDRTIKTLQLQVFYDEQQGGTRRLTLAGSLWWTFRFGI